MIYRMVSRQSSREIFTNVGKNELKEKLHQYKHGNYGKSKQNCIYKI